MDLCYRVPFWDKRQWEHYLSNAEEAEKAVRLGQKKVFNFPDFAAEVFHRLYSPHEAEPFESPASEVQWAQELHDLLSVNSDFQLLEKRCASSYYFAGIAAKVFVKELAQRLPEPEKPLENPHPLRSQVVALKKWAKQQQRELTESEQASINKLVEQGKQMSQALQEYAGAIAGRFEGREDEPTDENGNTLSDLLGTSPAGGGSLQVQAAIASAIVQASAQVNEAQEVQQGFGWGLEAGIAGYSGSAEDRLALAMQIADSPELKKIAKIAGRMKRLAVIKQRSKTIRSSHSIESVETGDNLFRVLPSELVGLVQPALKPLMLTKLAEKSLLQYKLGGKERLGQGPIIYLEDCSGSMEERGKKEWSKAILLALLGIAIEQKRHFRVIHYDSSVQRIFDFNPKQPDPKKLIQTAKFFSGGGTDWEEPLDKAVQTIETEKKLKNADIILATDGNCDVGNAWLGRFERKQQELEFTCFGIAILGRQQSLQRISKQHTITLNTLNNDQLISDVLSI